MLRFDVATDVWGDLALGSATPSKSPGGAAVNSQGREPLDGEPSNRKSPEGRRREGFSRVKGNQYKHDAQASESQRVKRHTRLRNVLVFPMTPRAEFNLLSLLRS